jgi:hypothetical protein
VDLVIGRRGLLSVGAGVAVAGAAGAAGGWAALHEGHGPAGRIPDVDPGERVGGTFASARRGGRQTSWSLAYPPGAGDRVPLLVFLHGLHQDHRTAFGRWLGLDRFLAAEVARQRSPLRDRIGRRRHRRTTTRAPTARTPVRWCSTSCCHFSPAAVCAPTGSG